MKYGKQLVSITEEEAGVTAIFEDGSSALGFLIVVCDGARSIVRELLVGKDRSTASIADVSMFNFPCKYDVETARLIRAQHPCFFNSFHRIGYMYLLAIQDVPEADKPETWSFQNMFSWRRPPHEEDLATQAERTAFLKSKAEEYAEPWETVIEKMPDNVRFGLDEINVWTPVDWSSMPLAGKVTLAGDTAHPMIPVCSPIATFVRYQC